MQGLRNKVKEEKQLEINGGLREDIGMDGIHIYIYIFIWEQWFHVYFDSRFNTVFFTMQNII